MPRITDEDEVIAVAERLGRLAMNVVNELARGIEHLQPRRLGLIVKGRRHAMRGKDDGRLLHGIDLIDRPHAEALHLLDDALVVYDLPKDRAASPSRRESLDLEVGDPD